MTRKRFRINVLIVLLIYGLFIFIGMFIYYIKPVGSNHYYTPFKDLILLWVALPAAYLSDCFQKRAAFTAALRTLWGNMIEAVNQARQYTFEAAPSQTLYGQTLKSLSKSIDEIRGVYRNIGENMDEIGIYPFESLKEISKIISKLGYNTINPVEATNQRKLIDKHWQFIKSSFLFEFDRPTPSIINSPYLKKSHYNHWCEFNPENDL